MDILDNFLNLEPHYDEEGCRIYYQSEVDSLINEIYSLRKKTRITPGGRYNGKRVLSLLSEIETIARDAFNDPETLDINLYRAQALARIFQLFEYNNEEAADNGEQGSN